jgi:cytoskeletal protein RodZ
MDARTRLNEARLAKRLTLAELSARTALSSAVLEKIDAGRFEELPAGVYARSYVRAFAVEVGLDPGGTLSTLEALLPVAHDPFPALQETLAAPPRCCFWLRS